MLIDAATFDEKRKSKRPAMALASVARKAGVSERTLARIKNKEEMNASTVEKIAIALDTSPEELCAPPRTRAGRYQGGYVAMQTELVAARYNVAPEIIEELAPLLFVAIAELSLHRRKERLTAWWEKVDQLGKIQPKFNVDSMAELEAKSGIASLAEAYWEEMEQINNNCLDGWATDRCDHFFDALYSVWGDFDFMPYQPSESDPFTYGGEKFEGNFADGSFPYPLESLKSLVGGAIFSPAISETASHLAGTQDEFYNPLGDDRSAWLAPEHPIAKMAEERLLSEYVPISQMPIELRHKKRALERAEWIASHGSDHPIPDVFYHWEAVRRIIECQYYENQSRELADQLQGTAPEERAAIEDELQAARDKSAAWRALIMPNDEEWYAKWTAYWEAQDDASCEEEAE